MRLIDADKIVQFITDGLNKNQFGHDAIEILTFIEFNADEVGLSKNEGVKQNDSCKNDP